jgi:hypothetical protein
MQGALRVGLCGGLLVVSAMACGCGGPGMGNCGSYGWVVNVAPLSATVNHSAAPPANQVQFIGAATPAPAGPGCAVPALSVRLYAAWTNPDPADITISSANDSTNGTALCKEPTNGAVTLTGAFSSAPGSGNSAVTKTVQLICE